MRVETLRKYFQRSERTKLYVAADGFLLAGYASHPREEGDSLCLDVGPYVVYSLERGEIIRSGKDFIGLRLDQQSKVTRRVQTHIRHIEKREWPEEYLKLARELYS